jgi:hypothetical protein
MHPTSEALEIRALAAISQDEEIFISYCQLQWPKFGRLCALEHWGFQCQCSLCHGSPSATKAIEQRRNACYQIFQAFSIAPGEPEDLKSLMETAGLAQILLDKERQECCLAWETFATATQLATWYRKLGRDRSAANCDHTAQEMAAVCYGKDFVMNEEFRDLVVHTRFS